MSKVTIKIWRSVRDRQWRVVLSRSGRIILSSEGYQRKAHALRMITNLTTYLRLETPVPVVDTFSP